jgi:hypothetical protein
MKTYEFKNYIFEYFNDKTLLKFPDLNGKIYRERLRINKPEFPFIVMKSGERIKINKRYETYYSNNTEYTRVQYRIPITFAVHDLKQSPIDAEIFTDDVIDYIESFFEDDAQTHSYFHEQGIVINELLCSGVRDISKTTETNQEFIKEIDITFEFEDLREIPSEMGKDLEININNAQ